MENQENMSEVLDLAAVEDVTEAEIQLKRGGTPLPAYVTLAGPEHPKRKKFALAKQRRIRKQLAKTGKVDFGDPMDDDAEEVDFMVDCILGWRGFVFGGKAIECNKENARRLLTDPKRQWLRHSIKEALDDSESFIKTSETA